MSSQCALPFLIENYCHEKSHLILFISRLMTFHYLESYI